MKNDILQCVDHRSVDRGRTYNAVVILTFHDDLFFKENLLLSRVELLIAVGLYRDDFEICNPLDTSRKKGRNRCVLCIG